MQTIDQIIERIIAEEGAAYTDDPRDAGGPTKYGITQRALAAWRGHSVSPEDVRALTMNEAAKIYRNTYFVKPGFNKVFDVSPAIAAELTDTGVNMGPAVAATFLQRALNAFNNGGKSYADIAADGVIGDGTISALRAFLNKRGADGEVVMLRTLNALQASRYIELAEKRAANEAFVFGWILNRVS